LQSSSPSFFLRADGEQYGLPRFRKLSVGLARINAGAAAEEEEEEDPSPPPLYGCIYPRGLFTDAEPLNVGESAVMWTAEADGEQEDEEDDIRFRAGLGPRCMDVNVWWWWWWRADRNMDRVREVEIGGRRLQSETYDDIRCYRSRAVSNRSEMGDVDSVGG
jgi:hypothetical protein